MKTLETASLILSALLADDAQTARELAVAIGTTASALRPALRQLVESGVVVTSGRGGGTVYVLSVVEQDNCPIWTEVTHVSVMGNGTRIEFRRSNLGPGWASRAVMPHCTEDWVYFGPELPRSAKPVVPPTTPPGGDPVQPVALEIGAAVQQQRAERSSTASLVLADEEPAPAVEPSAILRVAREVAIAVATQPARKPRAARPVIPATVDLEGALQATQARLEAGATLHELSARPAPPRIDIAELAAEVDALMPPAEQQPVATSSCALHVRRALPVGRRRWSRG